MTAREAYIELRRLLCESGRESGAFEAGCILAHVTGIHRAQLPIRGLEQVSGAEMDKMKHAVNSLLSGYPLQYWLGEWDFLNLTLEIGEGVLIPRADTELLCETVSSILSDLTLHSRVRILDLCAGSGCVGLGIASLCPGVQITAAELSDNAMGYLRRNCGRYPQLDVTPVQGDVIFGLSELMYKEFDVVVSNPPYIPAHDIPSLSREVQHEPLMALDGGDGLRFYRVITDRWLTTLRTGGLCAVEVGIGQADAVSEMFYRAGLSGISVVDDYNKIPRVVYGFRNSS